MTTPQKETVRLLAEALRPLSAEEAAGLLIRLAGRPGLGAGDPGE